MSLLGAGVVTAPIVARAGVTVSAADIQRTDGILSPLQHGSVIARWTIVAIQPLEEGAITLVVKGEDGHAFRLEVLARDSSPLAARPPAETERFAIHVCNGGDGWLPTHEEQGLAAMTLAQILARNEQAVSVEGFLTHAQRVAVHSETLLAGALPLSALRSKNAEPGI